jgi:signal peptidase I
MSVLTGVLYAALLVYIGGWLTDRWTINFAGLLMTLTVVTFGYWLAERLHFAPARRRAAEALQAQATARRAELARQGITQVDGDAAAGRAAVLAQPWWLDWTAGLFPVIVAVFVLRSFLFEPFRIPSGSMIPTLVVGDLILVNKFHYGLRVPVFNQKIVDNNAPARGDVVVFRWPPDPRIDYIKRIVGLPGDEVSYLNKTLLLNGKPVPTRAEPDAFDEEQRLYKKQFAETLGATEHRVLVNPLAQGGLAPQDIPFRDNCRWSAEGVVCKVPPGHYFVMGDNRDNSQDSRYWGFVPDENLVGRAFFVWMNFRDLGRIGAFN